MNIGIIDADLIGAKKHRFPNLASMKISSYNKNLGNDVKLIITWDEDFNQYDDIYLSKVFTATEVPQNVIVLPNIHCGGTGFFYDKAPPLKEEIEHCMPDYHLYDDWISTLVERERERERESNCRFISQQSETKENCKLHNRTSCTGWELDRKAKSQKQWSCQFCKKKRDIHFVGNISPINKRQNPNQGRVYMVDGICPTLTGMEGGGRQPHIIVRSAI